MRHHNSVFHVMLKHVPWETFEKLVEKHGADARVRQLATKSQLVALLYAQLSGAASLREITAALASRQARLYHMGAAAPKRSTLAEANAQRPADLFAALLRQVSRGLRKSLAQTPYLIDTTSLRLDRRSADR